VSTIVATLDRFSSFLRKAVCMFVVVPLLAAGLPFWVSELSQSHGIYRALSDRGVATAGQIVNLTETSGKVARVIVTSSFVAADGRRYHARASLYRSEVYRMRKGDPISVIYDRDNPGINARSLPAALSEVRAGAIFVVLMAGVLALVLWICRDDYRSLYHRMHNLASPAA
jgi:hypothetical protein